mgnify:CR=1 FL=1
MIGTIRKHQKWLWIIIIFVTIVTFVIFFSPSTGGSFLRDRSYDFGSIAGEKISAVQYQQARKEESLAFFLTYGEWPKQEDRLRQMGYDLESRTYQRLLINAKARQNKIVVSEDAIVHAVKNMFGVPANQSIPKDKYHEFLYKLAENDVTEVDFERFVSDQVAQQQLVSAYGVSGKLITPKEAEAFYRRENQPISAAVVRFSYTNYLSQVTPTPKLVDEYYTNNLSAYRLPERVQVNYVKFEVTNFLAEAEKSTSNPTNLTELINTAYLKQGGETFKDSNGKVMSEADAKAKIRREFFESQAKMIARKKAGQFLTALYDKYTDANPFKVEDFAEMAKSQGLVVQTTEPFDAAKGPKLNVSRDFVLRAFRMVIDPSDKSNKTLFCPSPIVTEDAVYAIALKNRYQSQVQPLAQVQAMVTADFEKEKATELAMAAGARFESMLTNGIATGKSFDAICAEAKVKPVVLAPFALTSSAPEGFDKSEFEQIQSAVYPLPNGKASAFIPLRYGGMIVAVKDRLAVDEAKLKTELPAFLSRMRDQRQSAAFGEWLQSQFSDLHRPATAKSKG